MPDTPPAGTGSGTDPVEVPATPPSVSREPHPPKPDEAGSELMVEPQNGAVSAYQSGNGSSPPPASPSSALPGPAFPSLSRYPEAAPVARQALPSIAIEHEDAASEPSTP